MNKGTVLNLKHVGVVFTFLKRNWCILLLCVLFLGGISCGTLIKDESSILSNFSSFYFKAFLNSRITGKFLNIFFDSFLLSFLFLILNFLFGTSVVGPVTIPIITFLRGELFGILAGGIYAQYELEGITFNAIILIPSTIISVISLLIAARDSMYFSLEIIDITLPQSKPKNLSFIFSKFCKKFLLLIIPILFSSLLEAWLSVKLISVFKLF